MIRSRHYVLFALVFLFLTSRSSLAVQEISVDFCVYGGTSGGVIAAVQAARMGKTVALVVVNNHLGGMTSGGLGSTDVGALGNGYIQGVAREFYTRVGQKYGTTTKFTFEPHVAETVFNEMAQSAGVAIYTNQYLVSVFKSGPQLVAITMNNSNVFRAKEFIDASYEGDLMAKAGVTYTIGREAISQYGEFYNGIRPAANNFGSLVVDPYLTPGNPGSGLLPLIQPGALGNIGDADARVQAYCYRMCLTTNATNRIAITAPPNYQASQYELLGRYIDAMTASSTAMSLSTFMAINVMPNSKTDINNGGAISLDYVGESAAYSEADYTTRQQIKLAHQNYINGLFYFLETDSRVPLTVRTQMQAYGYCNDEFADNAGWPYEFYVREARRMVSDYVMTQANVTNGVVASDSIGLAVYAADQHSAARLVINDTVMKLPGGGVSPSAPYPVAYRSIVPKTNECSNLLVPWCLSASHVAFCSLRMEPVFMITSQAAGTAACLAIDEGTSVQNLNVQKLQAQLIADGQELGVDAGLTVGPVEIVVDNSDATGVTVIGNWLGSTATAGFYGANYLHDRNTNKGASSVTFVPNLKTNGPHQVFAWWTAFSNRSTNTPIDVIHPGGTNTVFVDQTQQGSQWVWLLTTNFQAGTNAMVRIRNGGTTNFVIADAVKFVPPTNTPTINLWATDAKASRYGPQAGSFTIACSGNTTQPVKVFLNFSGTAANGTDFQFLTNGISLPAGTDATNIVVRPFTNALPVGDKTLVVTLASNAAYYVGPLNSAAITISDTPINQWRVQYFGVNATNTSIAGDIASPAGDGIPNLIKYALGLNPLTRQTNSVLASRLDADGFFTVSYSRPDPPPLDINYQLEGSSALSPWLSNAAPALAGLVLNSNNTATVTFRDSSPARNDPQSFRKLRVVRK